MTPPVPEDDAGAARYVLIPYVCADEIACPPHLRGIHVLEDGTPSCRRVGGVVDCDGQVLAFAASRNATRLLQGGIADILVQADVHAWGATRREAVMKIRDRLGR